MLLEDFPTNLDHRSTHNRYVISCVYQSFVESYQSFVESFALNWTRTQTYTSLFVMTLVRLNQVIGEEFSNVTSWLAFPHLQLEFAEAKIKNKNLHNYEVQSIMGSFQRAFLPRSNPVCRRSLVSLVATAYIYDRPFSRTCTVIQKPLK